MDKRFFEQIDLSNHKDMYIDKKSEHSRHIGTVGLLMALRFDMDIKDSKLESALSDHHKDYIYFLEKDTSTNQTKENNKIRILKYFDENKKDGNNTHRLLDIADALNLSLEYVEEIMQELSEEGRARYFPD